MSFEQKKSLGQHFLNSAHIPKKMCDAAHVGVGDVVLEIGPGTGILTREILDRGAKVIALEADTRAIQVLQETFTTEIECGQLQITHTDARTLLLDTLGIRPHEYTVVANIPYYLSGLLFRQLLDTEFQPHTLVFLIQKELAERIARDKKESLLSLSVKVFGDPTYICTVKRGHFTPPPKVDSAIIQVANISHERLTAAGVPTEFFFIVLHLGFGQKRKQLAGNLSARFPKEVIHQAMSETQLDTTIRAEDVNRESWIRLTKALYDQTYTHQSTE